MAEKFSTLDGSLAQDEWTEMALLLDSAPRLEPLALDFYSPELWKDAIKRMADRKATGICGWRPAELKVLPREALEILALLFAKSLELGIPPFLLIASVSVLAKVPRPEHIKQSRPIAVFSTIYRVWSSMVSRQILKQWGKVFPPSVMGSLPSRSARDLSYQQQHQIERAILDNRELFGLSLDIVRCFNCLPLRPIGQMMKRLGVPPQLVDCWMTALRDVRQHPVFLNCLGPPMESSTGVPEGDPLSVVAMAAVCFHAAHQPAALQVAFRTYVDNWSWQANTAEELRASTIPLLAFLDEMQLTVDWSKTHREKGPPVVTGAGATYVPYSAGDPSGCVKVRIGNPFSFLPNNSAMHQEPEISDGLRETP